MTDQNFSSPEGAADANAAASDAPSIDFGTPVEDVAAAAEANVADVAASAQDAVADVAASAQDAVADVTAAGQDAVADATAAGQAAVADAAAAFPPAPEAPAYGTPAAPAYGDPAAAAYGAPAYGAPQAPGYAPPQANNGPASPAEVSELTLNLWLSVFFQWLPALIFWVIRKDTASPLYRKALTDNLNWQIVGAIATYVAAFLIWLIVPALVPLAVFIISIIHAANVPGQVRAGQPGKFYFAPNWVK